MPPIITVGSASAAMKMWVHMEVVVVLPWVPDTHRALGYRCMMAPQAWARSYTGMPRATAPAISGLLSWTAAVRITRSQSPRFSALWPMATGMPRDRRWRTVSLSVMSEPWTCRPMPRSTSARGHMDTPPMPTRWARLPGTI